MWAFPGGRDVRKLLVAAACVLTFQSPGVQPGTMPRFLPGLLHVGRVLTAAPDSAQCEQLNHLPCYDPAQIDQDNAEPGKPKALDNAALHKIESLPNVRDVVPIVSTRMFVLTSDRKSVV